jgi:hypothetical protein
MGRAILASAAISGLVLPIALDGKVATDGGWVRTSRSSTRIATRRSPRSPRFDTCRPTRLRRRVPRAHARAAGALPGVPPVRALLAEVRLAQERAARGEPAHYGELIVRLMRVAFARTRSSRSASRRSGRRPCGAPCSARGRHAHRRAAAPPWRRTRLARSSTPASSPRGSRSATSASSRRSSCAARSARRASIRRSAATARGRTSASARSSMRGYALTDQGARRVNPLRATEAYGTVRSRKRSFRALGISRECEPHSGSRSAEAEGRPGSGQAVGTPCRGDEQAPAGRGRALG